jgi:hypothetical protein
VLNVAGHVRLQDAAWVEQLEMQASEEASTRRNLLPLVEPLYANDVPNSVSKTAMVKVNFMRSLLEYYAVI